MSHTLPLLSRQDADVALAIHDSDGARQCLTTAMQLACLSSDELADRLAADVRLVDALSTSAPTFQREAGRLRTLATLLDVAAAIATTAVAAVREGELH